MLNIISNISYLKSYLLFYVNYDIITLYQKKYNRPPYREAEGENMAKKTIFKPHVNSYCEKCKGTCWDPNDNSATQEKARKKFGTTPNNCVNSSDGNSRCPYA